ncbi:Tol-Pal system beta propeller repeat protein TolB [Paralimibaculum aggregatum]|uniref:Tol-Pal system protein TolB n=1 Tax=Paralimibaculum aggregatum TaxID=3036245 RepID=A0ABQ6LJ90_9RHOB|nr:Tol-Pal system beta propeller repeat protein TolB [Limibaculum sp. NKW23]GMG83342.1 Tol-Pal system beta propeller repeat protein TolB [Limibaculum sp. NKW23]
MRHLLARAGAALLLSLIATGLVPAGPAAAQAPPLQLRIEGAEFAPLPTALMPFAAGDGLAAVAAEIDQVLEADLERSGLFGLISPAAFIEASLPFDTVPTYANWRAIDAQALVTGRVMRAADGRVQVQFRIFDTVAETELAGLQLLADQEARRRLAHKVADQVYTALTGEGGYFDSRIAFVDETGPKGSRRKRIALMDQDGANVRYLTGADGLVLTPRISPDSRRVLYISYDRGQPEIWMQEIATGARERLGNFPGMSFAPRFSPAGTEVALSLSLEGNTDLYVLTLGGRQLRRLTRHPGIDTAPSFSPDGNRIVFESDRGGSQQLYVMSSIGGPAQRISFGQGSYGTPVWSPRGDLIAFTKIQGGRFNIGVMRADGSEERLLAAGFLVEGPSFSPNGRVIAFMQESPGQNGAPRLMSIDVSGRNLRPVPTPNAASDPAWSALLP